MVSLAACGSSGTKQATTATGVTSTLEGTITVAAAQSLSAAFTEIGADFEAKHPGLTVRFDFAGSAALVGQIEQGAPTDVFASADEANMQRVVAGGDADGTPTVFAHNGLAIAVAPGNPKHITTLRDLARPGVVVSLCAATVPCGSYARQAISKAGVAITPKSEETSVAGVLGRVQNGEADAGIVYTTDVKAAAGKVDGVMIPAAHNVVAAYPAVALRASGHRGAARAFVAYLRSKAGQATLAKYGFVAG
jgi:molybdate transport system substrate-binding protein